MRNAFEKLEPKNIKNANSDLNDQMKIKQNNFYRQRTI